MGSTFTVLVGTDQVEDYVIEVTGDDVVAPPASDRGEVDGQPGDDRAPGARGEPRRRWYWMPNLLSALPVTPQELAAEGVLVESGGTESPPGCEERLARFRDGAVTPS